ncbi:MAG: MAPEG family protein [Pseudomonadota bacterium]
MTVFDWLVLSAGLYFANILLQDVFGVMNHDMKALFGTRDGFEPKGVGLKRTQRAQANFTEAMAMFVPLALVAQLSGKAEGLATAGAAVFFWSRLAYLIAYVAGVPVVRSIVWMIGVVGLLMIFWAVAHFR